MRRHRELQEVPHCIMGRGCNNGYESEALPVNQPITVSVAKRDFNEHFLKQGTLQSIMGRLTLLACATNWQKRGKIYEK